MNEFVNTGKCIWCGQEAPLAEFNNRPHIVPDSLGGDELGYDICDKCNSYFGTCTQHDLSLDLVFKEIFNAYRVFSANLDEKTYKKLRSVFFDYRHSKRFISFKPQFKRFGTKYLARQFSRSLFYVFLQKYHKVTGDGNNPIFDAVRKYVRYNQGDLYVGYIFNNIILAPQNKEHPNIPMSDYLISQMKEYGVFELHCIGHIFYLGVLPFTFMNKYKVFFRNHASDMIIPAMGNERIIQFTDIMQIDFLMQRFNGRKN